MTISSTSAAATTSASGNTAAMEPASEAPVLSAAKQVVPPSVPLQSELVHPDVSILPLQSTWVPPLFTCTPTPPLIQPLPLFSGDSHGESSSAAAGRARFGSSTHGAHNLNPFWLRMVSWASLMDLLRLLRFIPMIYIRLLQ
ncbi:unnamed protein product [Cuscuta epithymum]|uniref:Uncharacterized protein n=1 Tax=Cuscuta epithymum TaxID=186058 RepID=A0AAV0CU33_9ASTE|nr:unnamed protein product [Cuscuta epithymum]